MAILALSAHVCNLFAVCIGIVSITSSSEIPQQDGVKLCPSPGGWHPCDCLHEVDSHSRIDEIKEPDGSRKVVFNFPNGTIRELPQCPHAIPGPPRSNDAGSADTEQVDVCNLGWAHAAPMEAFYQHSKNISNFTATYTVPDPPTNTSSNILYYWIGLQDLNAPVNSVIQPVLSWVRGSSENNWYFESWNCCPAGHKIKARSIPISGKGAKVLGSMFRDPSGLYTIVSRDSIGKSSVLYSNNTLSGITRSWDWVEVVLETYSVESCQDYSAGGQAQFLNMTLVDIEGQSVTPAWTMNPYINGKYLSPSRSVQFTSCCDGVFELSWPNATMQQNAAFSSRSARTQLSV